MPQKLDEVIARHKAVTTILNLTQQRALSGISGFDFLLKIDEQKHYELKKIKGADERSRKIKAYFDSLKDLLEENMLVCLVASFEKDVFDRLGDVISNASEALIHDRDRESRVTRLRQSLLKNKDDIFDISGVKKVLHNQLSANLQAQLTNIIEYRHHLAHGKRFSKHSSAIGCGEAYETLKGVFEGTVAINSK